METYHNVQPEIVIMDVQLPKYDGFYWCRQIRQVSNVPILFLSSRDNPMDQVMSMELGADDYMQKPFSYQRTNCEVTSNLSTRISIWRRRKTYIKLARCTSRSFKR